MLVTQTIKISFLWALLLLGASCSDQVITVESIESKTIDGGSVFNKIWLEREDQKDIWLMKQSHKGVNAGHEDWDELKIVVDKSKTPFKVSFEQFKEGRPAEFRASCFLCHSNGPRAIRANMQSKSAPLSVSNKLTILLYNFRMKTYGPVETVDLKNGKVSLKYSEPFEVEQLKVKTCLHCHNSDGIFSRGPLLRQHSETIRHLVDSGQMPPWPYKLSKAERKELNLFLSGL